MSKKARLEILEMVADGRISPEDGERLLSALDEGNPTHSSKPNSNPNGDDPPGVGSNIGKAFEDAAQAVKSAATEGVKAVQKVFDEHRPGTVPVTLLNNEFEVPDGAKLRIHPALRVSMGGGSAGGSVTIRGTDESKVRVVQGSAVEVHRYEDEFVLTWAKSTLELEVPRDLGALSIRGLGGNVGISEYDGPLRMEGLGGNFSIDGMRQSCKLLTVGGSIRIRNFSVTEGTSSIRSTGGDVQIWATPEASIEVRATSALGGGLELPRGASQLTTRTRRRGTCILGEGSGRLKIDTAAGWIRVHADHLGTAEPDAEEPFEEYAAYDDAEFDPEIPTPPGAPETPEKPRKPAPPTTPDEVAATRVSDEADLSSEDKGPGA